MGVQNCCCTRGGLSEKRPITRKVAFSCTRASRRAAFSRESPFRSLTGLLAQVCFFKGSLIGNRAILFPQQYTRSLASHSFPPQLCRASHSFRYAESQAREANMSHRLKPNMNTPNKHSYTDLQILTSIQTHLKPFYQRTYHFQTYTTHPNFT